MARTTSLISNSRPFRLCDSMYLVYHIERISYYRHISSITMDRSCSLMLHFVCRLINTNAISFFIALGKTRSKPGQRLTTPKGRTSVKKFLAIAVSKQPTTFALTFHLEIPMYSLCFCPPPHALNILYNALFFTHANTAIVFPCCAPMWLISFLFHISSPCLHHNKEHFA